MANRKITSDELKRDADDLTTEDFAYAYANRFLEFDAPAENNRGILVGFSRDGQLLFDIGPHPTDPCVDVYRPGWVFVQPVDKGRVIYVLGGWRDKVIGIYESEGALITPIKKTIPEYPHKCQRCGGPALELARTIDCPRGCWT